LFFFFFFFFHKPKEGFVSSVAKREDSQTDALYFSDGRLGREIPRGKTSTRSPESQTKLFSLKSSREIGVAVEIVDAECGDAEVGILAKRSGCELLTCFGAADAVDFL